MLDRLEQLCLKCGKSRDEVLDTSRLSFATGLTETEVEALLAGAKLEDPDPQLMIRQRVRFLYEHYRDETGRQRSIQDIAAAIGKTSTWVKKLVTGEGSPNLPVGHALCRYYGVVNSFLTDPPTEALQRELASLIFDLQIEADPKQALESMGVTHIARRSTRLEEPPNLVALAKMVADIQSSLNTVQNKLQALGDPEDNR